MTTSRRESIEITANEMTTTTKTTTQDTVYWCLFARSICTSLGTSICCGTKVSLFVDHTNEMKTSERTKNKIHSIPSAQIEISPVMNQSTYFLRMFLSSVVFVIDTSHTRTRVHCSVLSVRSPDEECCRFSTVSVRHSTIEWRRSLFVHTNDGCYSFYIVSHFSVALRRATAVNGVQFFKFRK